MSAMLQEWLSLFLRWAHVVAGISWIGSSFYFMWLDSSLKRRADQEPGVKGENWTVHGGGFYHTQKYMVAPEAMPDDLHWFRWESYFTWITGFALLIVIYYWSASSYLLDPAVADISPALGITISVASLIGGWVVYDLLCKSPLRQTPALLFAVLYGLIMFSAWAFGFVFSGRATFIQVGAMIATIMSANVFLVIIPNQRVVVADLKAGRTPDPKFGQIAKLRSTHNNYFTLPVLFLMLSNHYPATFGHAWNWAIVGFALALGGVIRHWFNTHEAGGHGRAVAWQWPAAAALAVGLVVFSAWRPEQGRFAPSIAESFGAGGAALSMSDADALAISQIHCATCHAAEPSMDGFDVAPGGVQLHTVALLRRHAARARVQVETGAMPLGGFTEMTAQERAAFLAWLDAGL